MFRPTASQQLSVWSNRFGVALGVFTGSNVASLQPVGTTVRIDGQAVFDAQAGETYHLGVGCPGIRIPGLYGFTCNLPLDLEIRLGKGE